MIINETKIKGVYVLELEKRVDERGYFERVFSQDELKNVGINYQIVQINRSLTKEKGIIRGMHFQKSPKAEDKIVQCLKGTIFDVALDIRKDSQTYGQWHAELLSSDNQRMLLIPKGLAHGFQAITNDCLVEYFVSELYAPMYESGIRWNDTLFNIDWPIKSPSLSAKDAKWPDWLK